MFTENRKKFLKKIGLDEKQVVSMHLTHSRNVAIVSKKDGGRVFENTDGLITNMAGIFLALPVGDCLPVMIYDPMNDVVGIVHAGWRGLALGILEETVKKMKMGFNSRSSDLTVYIGAYVCQDHYEVKKDVYTRFNKYEKALKSMKGKIFLDLGKIAKSKLQEVGVKPKKIIISTLCTYEEQPLFSYRRGDIGRNLYVYGMHSC